MIRLPRPSFQRVEIFWDDATRAGVAWADPNAVKATARCTTALVSIGYLVRVTPTEVTIIRGHVDLTREHEDDERWDGVFTIPRSTIRKVVRR